MALYGKKLNIKKADGTIQSANLYTDKTDVGSNYLTFKDGGNTVYSVLDVNGDMDCKVNKNGNVFKIKKENVISVPPTKQRFETIFDYTIPKGVKVIKLTCYDGRPQHKCVLYIGVQENIKYRFRGLFSSDSPYALEYTGSAKIDIYNYKTGNSITPFITNSIYFNFVVEEKMDCDIEYSNEINKHSVDYNI